MKVTRDQIANRLQQDGLPPVILIESNETLLSIEASDLIRHDALARGYERQVMDAGPGFSGAELIEARSELSLFATETLIELRIHKDKLDAKTAKALAFYLEDPPPEKRLVIQMPALHRDERKKAWVKQVDKIGWSIGIPTITLDGFDKWLRGELNQARVRLDDEAKELLLAGVEGNALAARQEVNKLKLFAGDEQAMTAQQVAEITSESARYTVFDLVDNCLAGQIEKVVQICATLEAEGVEPLSVMGMMHRTLENLMVLTKNPNDWQAARVFGRSQDKYRLALRRLNEKSLLPLLQQASRVDRACKGQSNTAPWLSLTQLALRLAGARTPAT